MMHCLSEEFIDHFNSLGKLDKTFLERRPLEPDFDDAPPDIDYDTLPTSFDSHSRWPHCNVSINAIGDQGG